MNRNSQATIIGLALGAFLAMLLILFTLSVGAVAVSAVVPLASLGVFCGAFAAALVTGMWACTGHNLSSGFLVTEMA